MAEAKQVDFLLAGLRHPLTDEPLAGGLVYTYEAGTSTPANLYIARDTTEGSATNPVVLDAFGRAEVYGDGVYKFVIRNAGDEETLIEIDNLEYKALLSDTTIPALIADLDFNGNKGINLTPGLTAGDTVEYQQFTNAVDALEASVTAVEASVTAVESEVAGLSYKFTDLTDTPYTLTGSALRLTRVNAAATAIELVSVTTMLAGGSFLNLSDTPAAYTGQTGKALIVNSGESALEFGYPDGRYLQGYPVSVTTPQDGDVLQFLGGSSVWSPQPKPGLARTSLGIHPGLQQSITLTVNPYAYSLLTVRLDYNGRTYHATIDPGMYATPISMDTLRYFVAYDPEMVGNQLYVDITFSGSYIVSTNAFIKEIVGYK